MNKKEIKNFVLQNLEKMRANLEKSREEYKKAANDAPSAMQSHSDTSKFQFNILAENFVLQLQKLDDAIIILKNAGEGSEKVGIGTFLKIKENGKPRYFYFVPEGAGGFQVEDKGILVRVLAINSPIGAYFSGKKIGDKIEMNLPSGRRQMEILEVK